VRASTNGSDQSNRSSLFPQGNVETNEVIFTTLEFVKHQWHLMKLWKAILTKNGVAMQIAILEDLFLILKLEYLNTSRSAFLFRTSLTLPPNALNSKWSLWPQTSETADTNVCLKMSKTCKWRIGNYLVPVTVSQRNQFYRVICKTFASTNSHLFVSLGYFGLQLRWSLKLHFFL
jgi:hypothetical protein